MREIKINKSHTRRDEHSFNKYLCDINNFGMITPEEEVILAQKIKAGDDAALDKLVTANLRFVISCAKKYQNNGFSLADLVNEGNIGLITAARRFDETKGFKFVSYAVWWIRQSIMHALNENARLVRLPMNQQLGMMNLVKTSQLLEQTLEREPTIIELSESMEIPDNKLADFIYCNGRTTYLEDCIPGGDNDQHTLLNYLPAEEHDPIKEWINSEAISEYVVSILKDLSPRERYVLTLCFGLFGSPSFEMEDVAIKINLSTERTRQIKTGAIQKIRRTKTPFYLED
ncbi:sigma-70 family RNA polymerase sigma factor [Pedobacter sp. PWIIR3]